MCIEVTKLIGYSSSFWSHCKRVERDLRASKKLIEVKKQFNIDKDLNVTVLERDCHVCISVLKLV